MSHLFYTPAPYQWRMCDYLDENPHAKVFATMGARKTATLIYHSLLRDFRNVLIVCMKSNIKTWCDQFDEWFCGTSYTPVFGTPDQKVKLLEECLTRFTIINYDGMKRNKAGRKVYDTLRKLAPKYDRVIFDESYEVANTKSNRFKDIRRIASLIPNRVIMDGEPTAEGIDKLFGQYLMCDDGDTFGKDYWKFKNKYFYQPPNLPFTKWVLRANSEKKVQQIVQSTAFVYTEADLDRDVGLPTRVDYPVNCEALPDQKRIYKQIKTDWQVEEHELKYTMERISKGRQVLDGFYYLDGVAKRIPSAKEKTLLHLLTHQLKHKKKIVVFAAFRESLQIVSEIFDKAGRKSVAYYGGLDLDEKAYALEAFKNDDEIEGFICQGGCGVGLNELVVSNVAIYYSNTEKRRDRAQSIKRQIRPTQKASSSYVIDMIIPGTYDELIFKRLRDKKYRSMMLLTPKDARK